MAKKKSKGLKKSLRQFVQEVEWVPSTSRRGAVYYKETPVPKSGPPGGSQPSATRVRSDSNPTPSKRARVQSADDWDGIGMDQDRTGPRGGTQRQTKVCMDIYSKTCMLTLSFRVSSLRTILFATGFLYGTSISTKPLRERHEGQTLSAPSARVPTLLSAAWTALEAEYFVRSVQLKFINSCLSTESNSGMGDAS
jgi:hypothetical protein